MKHLNLRKLAHNSAEWIHKQPIVKFMAALSHFSIILAAIAFIYDLSSRIEERSEWKQNRIVQAWQLITTKALGNSGKASALEYLYSQGIPMRGIDLSCTHHGGVIENNNCSNPVYLSGIMLAGIDGKAVDLSTAKLSGANLTGADLRGANLVKVDLRYANLSRSSKVGCGCPTGPAANLHSSHLTYADLSHTDIQGCNISHASLYDAKMVHVAASGADFSHSDMRNVNLSGSMLFGADFSYADLSNADMTDTKLGDELYLPFSGTNISNVDFSRATGLTQEDIDKAWAWSDAPPRNLPAGLKMNILCYREKPKHSWTSISLPSGDPSAAQKPKKCIPPPHK